MNFFQKLFGGKSNEPEPVKFEQPAKPQLTPEEFMATDAVKQLVAKYKKQATLLRPHRVAEGVSPAESKFGGEANMYGFSEYPCCDFCKTPFEFIVQAYKRDFEFAYFPNDSNLFQLFRCPNENCAGYEQSYYFTTKVFYFNVPEGQTLQMSRPAITYELPDGELAECSLSPLVIENDLPVWEDYEGNDGSNIEEQFGEEWSEYLMEEYNAKPYTKFGGYPSFTQGPFYPECKCGKTKEFFFQLSSDDPRNETDPKYHSPHGIMIGDMGNVYFYVCKACGPPTIESYMDCC
ncbi:MAG: DUF1963 domain-containing protein [Chitinophagales bacterium]|nr:DUF1963 domain-containing protein [Chitinophagales bacterium]